jgi:hypothetical protein
MCDNVIEACPKCEDGQLTTSTERFENSTKKLVKTWCRWCGYEKSEWQNEGHPAKKRLTKGAERNV